MLTVRSFLIFIQLALAIECSLAQSSVPGDTAIPSMRVYIMGLYYRGPAWTPEKTDETRKLQEGHMANLLRMAKMGILVGAGPIISDTSRLRGILIFEADSINQVEPEVARDPSVIAERLMCEFHPWYGPVGIGKKYQEMAKDTSRNIPMVKYQFGLLKRGPKWTPETTPGSAKLQEAHLENIRLMIRDGHLKIAGPFEDDGMLRGVFVFKMDSLSAARALADKDPTVRAGRLKVDLYPWICADGVIPELPRK